MSLYPRLATSALLLVLLNPAACYSGFLLPATRLARIARYEKHVAQVSDGLTGGRFEMASRRTTG